MNWKSQHGRNPLGAIKTHEDLQNLCTALRECKKEALEGSRNLMQEILEDLCLEDAVVTYFLKVSRLPRISTDMVTAYEHLVTHLESHGAYSSTDDIVLRAGSPDWDS